MSIDGVKALTFDVFGTVVDWRSCVIREAQALGARLGVTLDWPAFVDRWRYEGYIGEIGRIIKGEREFTTTDNLHRTKLDALLAEHSITVSKEDADDFNRAWHRLDPWPDSVAGLGRLKQKYIISTLSNGNVALLVDMAKYAKLPWDCILSADLVGAFKPDPQCYLRGAAFLGLEPHQVMMVAAHKADLRAAAAAGLRTAYIPRPLEAGPSRKIDLSHDAAFDFNADSLLELADKLACPE
ncbi:haloacid dehalogenase [bacterium SCGC AG-212-C10]|nr:haloacid dehalogenase [bacterium SCGC AG-212-C10]